MFDIFTDIALPMWALLLIGTTVLPWLQALITKRELDGTSSKAVTLGLSVVASLLLAVSAEGGFSIADLLMLAAPGVFISSNSYDKVWQLLNIRDFLAPDRGIG